MELDNKTLLELIINEYGYEARYNEDGSLKVTDFFEDCEFYNSVELALIDWLPTLVESEKQNILENVDMTWIPEINRIKEIKSDLKFNELSTSLKDNLVYGEIPNEMYKNLSVFIDEQTALVNSYLDINMDNDNSSNVKIIKASLPTEFILENKELEYIKIANLDFIKRLLKGDASEIEFDEVDIYDHQCRETEIPLMPFNSVEKFEINIPVLLTLEDTFLRLLTPINPLYLI